MTEPTSDEELVRRWLKEGCPSWGAPIDSIRRQSQEIERLRGALLDVANATPTMADLRNAQLAVRDLLYENSHNKPGALEPAND